MKSLLMKYIGNTNLIKRSIILQQYHLLFKGIMRNGGMIKYKSSRSSYLTW
jgi:hypothetical protein